MSGYFTAFEGHGTDFSYSLYPSAKIFRRDQGKAKQCALYNKLNILFVVSVHNTKHITTYTQVVDMDSMMYIMRYNDYKNDLYSLGIPMTEPPTFHLIFSYYTLINSVFFKPFPYVHGYTLYHMHEKGWGWMLQSP